MKNVNIKISLANPKTLMAASLLSMAFDESVVKDAPTGEFETDAIITTKSFDFNESIKSTRKTMVRMGNTPSLSIVGLVWKHYGLQILDKLECLPEYQEIVWRRIDREFISTLDSCSAETFELADFPTPTKPTDKMLEEDFLKYMQEQILKHIDFLSSCIYDGIVKYGTECYVQELLNEKGDKDYIELDNGNLPWREKVKEYNRFNQGGHPVKFVVYPYETGFIGESFEMFSTGIPDKLEPQKCFCINKDFLIEAFTKKLTEAE